MSFSICVNNLEVESFILDVKILPHNQNSCENKKTSEMFSFENKRYVCRNFNVMDILVSYLN